MTDVLVPFENSFNPITNTDYEQELMDIIIQVFSDALKPIADEINVYGMPHLGPFDLIERFVTADGLAVMRKNDLAAMNYLYEAWKFRNTQRGTHFLRTYLRILFGDVFVIDQLWQKKDQPYPAHCRSKVELTGEGDTIDEYFLTSRLRVDLDTESIPVNVLQSLLTTVAARFVLQLRVAKYFKNNIGLANNVGGNVVFYGAGQLVPAPKFFSNDFSVIDGSGGAVIFYASGELVLAQYLPTNLLINEEIAPVYITGPLSATWSEASLIGYPNVTYRVEVYGESDSLIHTEETPFTVFNYSKPQELLDSGLDDYNSKLRLVITALSNGIQVGLAQDHTFGRAGFGMNFGLYFGAGE